VRNTITRRYVSSRAKATNSAVNSKGTYTKYGLPLYIKNALMMI
jgi:hypothetical protein